MEKMVTLRSLCRLVCSRSYSFTASKNHHLRRVILSQRHHFTPRSLLNLCSSYVSASPNRHASECRIPLSIGVGNVRFYSEEISHLPAINDLELLKAFNGLMAASWDELPYPLINDLKEALSKNTDVKAGKDVVENVLRAAEACEEFGGTLMTLKMEIDDSIGLSGEDAKPVPDYIKNALNTVFDRYTTYLNSFGPDESYLRKKVETELGTKMIYLKMRCGGLNSEWGKVTVLGTSGLSGSYIEKRA
ncbi:hypothetical protein L6164_015423 [Bauhinia variegata]|uniref:Uncharacterized protein n=1 Tax=Bauhinia variegata TaxID=167791 RepID=A0ACB9NKA2_BAUVA|nr:hypothetical protein L6164_015423 [Bauhinia variegata]